ncbi:MAG: hypothetical protein ACOYXR_09340 [Nitrospirota bacterium]
MALTAQDFEHRPRKGPPCSMSVILAALSDKDRDVLLAALQDRTVTNPQISRVLEREGHNIAAHTIGNHRRGSCSCGR